MPIFTKGEDRINISPEEAIKFQGGSAESPFGGLERSGWSQLAPDQGGTAGLPEPQAPNAGAGAGASTAIDTASIISNLNAKGFASSALPDLTADIARLRDEENLAKSDEEARALAIKKAIAEQFAKREKEIRATGEKQISSQEAQLGIARGLGASSSRMAFINQMKSDLEDSITELRKDMSSALASADLEAADRAEKKIKDLREMQFKLQNESFDQSLAMLKENREQIKFQQDQQESAIGNILSQLTGNEETDSQIIKKLSTQFNIDPATLASASQQKNIEIQQQNLDLAKQKYDIAKQIPEGESFTDPDTGVIIMGAKKIEGEIMDIVQTVGGNEFKVRMDLSDPANPKELFRIDLGPRWKGGGSSTGISPENPTTIDEALLQTIDYLNNLKASGQFNDVTYNVAINSLAGEYGIDDVDMLKSTINQKLGALEAGTKRSIGATGTF